MLNKKLRILVLPLVLICFLLAGYSAFMEVKALTVINPVLLTVIQGTQANGTLSDLTISDADILTINEANGGTNGIQAVLTFSNVNSSPLQLELKINCLYIGSSSHSIDIQLYNYAISSYVTLAVVPNEVSYIWHNITLTNTDLSVYVSGGVVKVQLLHVQSGIQSHRYYLDTVELIETLTPTATPTPTPTPITNNFNFNPIMFIVLLLINIALCIKKVPILGFSLGFLSLICTFTLFINDVSISLYLTYLLIVIAFVCMIINGLDVKKK